MRVLAPAKINWSLTICGRRPDGYHELDMLMQTVSLCDVLELDRAEETSLCVNEERVPGEAAEKDLTLRALRALEAHAGRKMPLCVRVEKRIPARAGLGGGSSDCAAVLKAACELFSLHLDDKTMGLIALSLGADVPFFLQGGLCRVQGIGEQVERLSPAPEYWLVIQHVSPGLSTPEVYREYDKLGASSTKTAWPVLALLQSGDFAALGKMDLNALEAPAVRMLPAIAKAKRQLLSLGALHALMSGSGSAVYGVFAGEREARQAASGLEGALLARTTAG